MVTYGCQTILGTFTADIKRMPDIKPKSAFDIAYARVSALATTFQLNEARYLSSNYQEAEVRKDFIDKFFVALGWDVNHDDQTNPYEQEVKVEPPVSAGGQRRADYASTLHRTTEMSVSL